MRDSYLTPNKQGQEWELCLSLMKTASCKQKKTAWHVIELRFIRRIQERCSRFGIGSQFWNRQFAKTQNPLLHVNPPNIDDSGPREFIERIWRRYFFFLSSSKEQTTLHSSSFFELFCFVLFFVFFFLPLFFFFFFFHFPFFFVSSF